MSAFKYKWNAPYNWLEEKAKTWTQEELMEALLSIALQVDSDTLQDIFQNEMEEDGYFEELKKE